MSRLPLVLVVVAACGGSSKPPPTAPLPPEAPKASTQPAAPAGEKVSSEADKQAEPAPARPTGPTGPIELKIPAQQTTVKLVSDGKGKKQPLRYTSRPGAKQAVEVAMDFTGKQDADEEVVPTIVLTGDAETRTVDKDGSAEYTLTVTAADVRAAPGSQANVEKFKAVLGQLAGLTITGKRGADGTAGEVTLHLEHPLEHGEDALQLIRFTFPALPILPAQAVGVGARWQATASAKLAEKLDVTQVTDYELVAHDGATWKIKGTTKVSGKDQGVDGAKISGIAGTGTSETSITDGALYPAHKASLETRFTVTDGDKSSNFALRLGGAVTPR